MTLNWSDASRDDLRGILVYVGRDFGRLKAERVLSNIRERAEQLTAFPKLGRVFAKDHELGITYRSLTVKLNKIVYYIDGEEINIVTVWQNRQDISRLKKQLTRPKVSS